MIKEYGYIYTHTYYKMEYNCVEKKSNRSRWILSTKIDTRNLELFRDLHFSSLASSNPNTPNFHFIYTPALPPTSISLSSHTPALSIFRTTMARGSSQSQSSTSSARPGLAAPRGSAAATAGMRRRRLGGGGGGGSSGGSAGAEPSNMLRFYTDEAPGLKISPTVVLVMSLCFIGFVTALHVFGKLYRHTTGSDAPDPTR
ncbi:PREDICTED: uncharacterized protein LOC104799494 [Tarenaya hassleriana]|uniref:uncharacterized protein LOC104799494 n=1 Tax=Tarenaya hassleriana TaxID=28532 RepID=UPI00053C8077|nr:PREDICTED: uncharacterized protein LOC104799494 [Tarenaya hassleriana]